MVRYALAFRRAPAKAHSSGVISSILRSDSAQGLNFAIPINYVRGLLNNLHEPMTLEQMRRSLSPKATSKEQREGPTLEETLAWLRETIPLGMVQSVPSMGRILLDERSQSGPMTATVAEPQGVAVRRS
jgi:S1-C subfamily serine protease